MADVQLATSLPPRITRETPGGTDIGPAWLASCIASWTTPGWSALSLNPAAECAPLRAAHPVFDIREAAPGVEQDYGRPGVWLDDILATLAATTAPVVGIVNADIRLDLSAAQRAALAARAAEEIVLCNRLEIRHPGQQDGRYYRYGYDLVLMPRAAAARLDMAGFGLGLPWWDYWAALDALLAGIPVSVVQCNGIRHLTHAQAWNPRNWERALHALLDKLAQRRTRADTPWASLATTLTERLVLGLRAGAKGGYLATQMTQPVGTILGLEIVRLAEQNTWRLE